MIQPNTLYYTFSTIAQVNVALIAIIAVFIHFRINRLQDYLVGDGLALLQRYKGERKRLKRKEIILTDCIYNMNEISVGRLRDGIYRKNIKEIGEILKHLSDWEEKSFTMIERPHGFQYVYKKRFKKTEKKIKSLKVITVITASLVVISIMTSIVYLSFIDLLSQCMCLSVLSLFVNICMVFLSLVMSLLLLIKGLREDSAYEVG